MRLDETARQFVRDQEAAMRRHAADAIAASNRWRQRDAELAVKYKAERRTPYGISQAKAIDMPLNDAYAAYSFHSGKAQMHAAVIQATFAAAQLLADDDPTGLLYSRDDDEPVRPVPPHVDGLSITGRAPRRRPADHPMGEADARLATAGGTAVRKAPNSVGAPFGAGTTSPAGSATDTNVERRTSSFPGRSGNQRPAALGGQSAAGQAGAGNAAPAPAAPRAGAR